MMGSGIGSVAVGRFIHVIDALFQAARPSGFRIACKSVPLSQVERAWPLDDGQSRTVFTMD